MDTVSPIGEHGNVTPDEPFGAPKAPHTSFSQIETYRTCSLKYFFRYIEKRPEPKSLPLARGSAGHAAIEVNHRRQAKTGVPIPKQELLDKFSDAYDAETYLIERDALETDAVIGKTKDDVVDSLTVYHGKTAPGLKPLLVEHAFSLDIPATEAYEYPIKIVEGRIDLIDGGSFKGVLDAKFAGRAKSQGDVDESWQLSLYDEVFEDVAKIPAPNLGFMVFLPPGTGKVPNPARVQILQRSPEELEPQQRQRRRDRLHHVLRTTQKAIDAGIFMPADDPKVCGYCPYRKECKFSLAKDDFAAIAIRQKG